MIQTDTICALATATGGALGVIRISGPAAVAVACSICRGITPETPANTVNFVRIVSSTADAAQPILDEAMASIFRAPHSYTGEDCVELSCHGSRYILNKVLELLVQNGCRMARPGEYTQRAYLNGKMDLAQAEAVADLIASSNQATHRMAISQLRGGISNQLADLRKQLLTMTSLLELELDFSDHEDLEFANRSELLTLAQTINSHIVRLTHTFETGQALKQGIPVAIVGKTNVGKSTLLNQLLKDDRAIVSDIHGTTRDTIEDTIDIHGITFRFIDTAGIRNTTDTIEQIGINRTYAAIEKARIVLWMLDEKPAVEELQAIEERCKDKSLIIIYNKCDIKKHIQADESHIDSTFPHTPILSISAKNGEGIDTLENTIYNLSGIPDISGNDIIITSTRHYEALLHAHDNLSRVIDGLLLPLSSDLIAEDLRLVLSDLGEITGQNRITPQETLNNIFSHFCVGK